MNRIHMRPPPVPIRNPTNPVHAPLIPIPTTHLNIILPQIFIQFKREPMWFARILMNNLKKIRCTYQRSV